MYKYYLFHIATPIDIAKNYIETDLYNNPKNITLNINATYIEDKISSVNGKIRILGPFNLEDKIEAFYNVPKLQPFNLSARNEFNKNHLSYSTALLAEISKFINYKGIINENLPESIDLDVSLSHYLNNSETLYSGHILNDINFSKWFLDKTLIKVLILESFEKDQIFSVPSLDIPVNFNAFVLISKDELTISIENQKVFNFLFKIDNWNFYACFGPVSNGTVQTGKYFKNIFQNTKFEFISRIFR